MMKSKEVVAGDSENEFEVDEPEEVADHSDDDWAPAAAVSLLLLCKLINFTLLKLFRLKLLVNVEDQPKVQHLVEERNKKYQMMMTTRKKKYYQKK